MLSDLNPSLHKSCAKNKLYKYFLRFVWQVSDPYTKNKIRVHPLRYFTKLTLIYHEIDSNQLFNTDEKSSLPDPDF